MFGNLGLLAIPKIPECHPFLSVGKVLVFPTFAPVAGNA
jgi:hypothetical protein